ncbi:MAG: FtsX-like permease family protein [Woeseiaceae bacterium]|nr:FtsX-like permease family protein [Woeseiaceae bacterium]
MNIVFRLAWRNLWRHTRRTWLTTGAMIFSNALLVFMIALQLGAYDLMIDNSLKAFTGHVQVQAPGYLDDGKMRQAIPDVASLAAALRAELGTDRVAARAAGFALASSEDRSYGVAVYGVEPQFEPGVSSIPGLVSAGRYLEPGGAPEIVIGEVLARNLKVQVGDELTLLGSGLDGSFAAAVVTVAGVFSSGIAQIDRGVAELPLALFDDVYYMNGAGHQVVVNAPAIGQAEELRAAVADFVSAARPDLVVHDWDALEPGLRQAIRADMSSAFFMYGVLVVLVAFSVLNTQLMSVLERTREFGIVLALGLRPGRLGRLVLLETALMGLLGLVIGAFLGALVVLYFNAAGFSYPGMEEMAAKFNLPASIYPSVSLLPIVAGPSVVFVFTILAALYPAQRLYRLQPVDAMRAA